MHLERPPLSCQSVFTAVITDELISATPVVVVELFAKV